ncbi:DUF3164 family protein [Pseudomonas sp.]|uniref:DUF3164 family protein n=1 Tax=Pseudomonas sp. TaxID=306 RepID=UPI003D0F7CC9
MTDPQGRMVPIEMVKEIDLERDALVKEIVGEARRAAEVLKAFKHQAMGDVGAFVELSAEKYGAKLGGNKGNVTLTSYDGQYKIQRAIAEHVYFDERLQAAKALIDECIHAWSVDSRPEIKVLIDDAFQVDKQGNINTNRILSLRRLPIKDEKWGKAMEAIGDALQVGGSKAYLRIYERQADGSYRQINLDMAAI